MENEIRLSGTKFWVNDTAMFKGNACKVVGVTHDADADKILYDVEVPVDDGKFRGGMKFYRIEQASEEELASVPTEAAV